MPNRVDEDMSWDDAIIAVLQDSDGAMHYADIAAAIVARRLRKNVGATPAQTVNAKISVEIKYHPENSRFARVGKGEYMLKQGDTALAKAGPSHDGKGEVSVPEEVDLLTSFGMYWRRDLVVWTGNPGLYGQQYRGANKVDFSRQKGVYLLHDNRDVVYVGCANQSLGERLSDHVVDRLNGRWNRFSWFGVLPVTNDGKIVDRVEARLSIRDIVSLMEALLIETIEPPLNRKRGNDIQAVEYIQVEDERIKKRQLDSLWLEIREKLQAD